MRFSGYIFAALIIVSPSILARPQESTPKPEQAPGIAPKPETGNPTSR
jgi:hypothetical protein